MRKVCEFLSQIDLFRGLSYELFDQCCTQAVVESFAKGDLVVHEGERCQGIGIILEGQLTKQKYSSSGSSSTLDLLGTGDTFGEDLIFSKLSHYLFSLEAVSSAKVVYIPVDTLLQMISRSPQLISNFVQVLSDRLHYNSQRIYTLTQRTLRDKISSYLIELLREQLVREDQTLEEASQIISTQAVELPSSKEVVARLLAMPRPSFSRELISMEKDGLIRVSGRVIWLLNLEALESGLTEDYT